MTATPVSPNTEVVVWDPLVRIFHWSLVANFTVAYLSGEDEMLDLHAWSGYIVGGLILFRLLWGLVGPRHAHFADFVFTPATILKYGRGLRRGQAQRTPGHNPLGGAVITGRKRARNHVGKGLLRCLARVTRVRTFPGAIGALYRYNPLNEVVGKGRTVSVWTRHRVAVGVHHRQHHQGST